MKASYSSLIGSKIVNWFAIAGAPGNSKQTFTWLGFPLQMVFLQHHENVLLNLFDRLQKVTWKKQEWNSTLLFETASKPNQCISSLVLKIRNPFYWIPWSFTVATRHLGQSSTCLSRPLVLLVILVLIRVTYQFANNVKKKCNWVNKSVYKHGLFFAFLSKAAKKCRCFSLAQCFLWWWG